MRYIGDCCNVPWARDVSDLIVVAMEDGDLLGNIRRINLWTAVTPTMALVPVCMGHHNGYA